jgi:hypothetical protein
MADGWTELGAGLAGGWGDGREAFVKQMKLHGEAGEALAKAARARSMAMAHANITPEAMQALMTGGDGQYGTMAAIAAASANPDLRRLGDFQRPQYAALELERQEAMRSGNFKRMNAITSVLGDDPHKPYDVEAAGKLVFDPVTGETVTTPLGQSAMSVDAARVRRADASAGASNARAGVYGAQAAAGGWKPSAPRAPKTLTEPEANAKIDWIMAQATKKAQKESPEFVEAWIQNEMVKAGLQPLPPADFSGVTGAATTVPVLGGDMPASPAIDEEAQALADAQRAIATGRITKEEARQRLLAAGLTGAAGRL